ncbi:hypothetical protein [Empedobacter brevis]|uniref:hypothetical protein n=1 Tax=Empedobacter brevis TaxID=247 RepID=UPI0028D74AA7|nr:hypothetical protein [Empedobacter brevis]
MTVQEWKNRGKDYAIGVQLYSASERPNRVLIANFLRKETSVNRAKLEHELAKLGSVNIPLPLFENDNSETEELQNQVDELTDEVEDLNGHIFDLEKQIKNLELPFKKKPLAAYPPELHQTFISRVKAFYHWCELKLKLNLLPEESEKEALELLIEIDKTQAFVNRCWRILDYYDETKNILHDEIEIDYSKLSFDQQSKQKQLIFQKITKRKKTIDNLYKRLQKTLDGKKKLTIQNRLHEKHKELFDLERQKDELITLTSKYNLTNE